MPKKEKPAAAPKPSNHKKASRKRNGVPNYKLRSRKPDLPPRESTLAKLLLRPLHEHGRSMRLARKLNLLPRRESTC